MTVLEKDPIDALFELELDYPQVVADVSEMPEDEWLQLRRTGIGGSDVAGVAGLSNYSSPYSLWAEKVGEAPLSVQENERMRWGKVLEGPIAEEWGRREGLEVVQIPVMLAHPEHRHMIVDVDRFIVEDDRITAALEIKNTDGRNAKDWEENSLPDAYALQAMHTLAVTGLPRIPVVALLGGNELRCTVVERDELMIERLIELETNFWERFVVPKSPPAIDGHPRTLDVLKSLYASSTPDAVVQVDPSMLDLVRERERRRLLAVSTKRGVDDIDAQIIVALGTAEVGMLGDRIVVTRKTSEVNGYYVEPRSQRTIRVPKSALA